MSGDVKFEGTPEEWGALVKQNKINWIEFVKFLFF